MNIEDKSTLVNEVRRVLRLDGQLALDAYMAGSKKGLEYPVFWADAADVNFIVTPQELRQLMVVAGFREVEWIDVTRKVLDRRRSSATITDEDQSGLGLHLIYDDVPLKRQNTYLGFQKGIINDVHAVFRLAET